MGVRGCSRRSASSAPAATAAQVEGGRAERPELAPPEAARRVARTARRSTRRGDVAVDGGEAARRPASRPRPAPPRTARRVARLTTSAADRTLGVDGAQADVAYQGMPRSALVEPSSGSTTTTTSPSGSVQTRSPPTARRRPRREHTPSAAASAARSLRYWPVRVAGQAPVVERRRARRRWHRAVQSRRAELSPHRRGHSSRSRLGHRSRDAAGLTAVAVIDVAGFVADLKDHAVDHGFHVHDERHFVETYSLRQAWEVDLHPEEALRRPARPAPGARGRPAGAARVRGRGARRCRRRRRRPTSSTSR